MEPITNMPQPVVQPQLAAPINNQAMNVSSNNIVSLIVLGIVGGFAFGLGSYLAQKVTKKKPDSVSETLAMNGYPMSAYPPRDNRMAQNGQRNRYMQNNNNNGYDPNRYYRADGNSTNEFSVDAWLQSNSGNIQQKTDQLLEKASD